MVIITHEQVPDDDPIKTKCLAEYLTYGDNLDEIR